MSVCVCACIWVQLHVRTQACGDQKLTLHGVPLIAHLVSSDKVLYRPGTCLIGQAGWTLSSRDLPVSASPPSAGGTSLGLHAWPFRVYLGDQRQDIMLVGQALYLRSHLAAP